MMREHHYGLCAPCASVRCRNCSGSAAPAVYYTRLAELSLQPRSELRSVKTPVPTINYIRLPELNLQLSAC
jgi:hypothetical protein